MNIKKNVKNKKFQLSNFFLKLYFFLTIFIAFLILLLFFNTGYWGNYKDKILHRLHISSVINYTKLPKIFFHKIMSVRYEVPKVNLSISFKNILDLENQRKNAIKVDQELKNNNPDHTSPNFQYVNVKISHNNKKYPAKLRIKGDRKSHWFEGDSVSYKLSLRDENKIFGMKRFALQKPRMRNYIHEWIFFELIGELELIKLKYLFLNLNINGENKNLYVLEESFDKALIERNKKRNGPIFSLYENFSMNPQKAKYDVYNKKYWTNKENLEFTENASKKLENFYKSSNDNLVNFDVEKWAKFFAITDLNFYNHARVNKSVRYYYNPISALFEPIGYDGHRSQPNYSKYINNWKQLNTQNSFEEALTCKKNLILCVENQGRLNGNYMAYKFFFNNQGQINLDFFSKYKKWTQYLASNEFLDEFFENRKEEIKKINSLIYDDYFFTDHNYFYGPGIYYFSKEDIYLRAKTLKNYFLENPDKVFIEQFNTNLKITNLSYNNLSLQVDEIQCRNQKNNQYKNFKINLNINIGTELIELKNFTKESFVCEKIILSNNKKKITKIINQTINDDLKFRDNDKNIYKKFFIQSENYLVLKNNITYIDKNIYIPSKLNVKISPGQKIFLTDNAFIFSKSAWLMDGKNNQIEISGLEDNFGGGLLISNVNEVSYFDNVKFKYLSGLKKPLFYDLEKNYSTTISGYDSKTNLFFDTQKLNPKKNILYNINYHLMGSVNIFNSNLIITNTIFEKICSEDALNIISSQFTISKSYFNDNCSDGIDVDFGNGEIFDTSFYKIGNDAIDFSGSKANLQKIYADQVGDKIISVGEKSFVKIDNLEGNNSFVGIVSKDESIIKMQNIMLDKVKIGLASYIKKNEYEKAMIYVKNFKIKNDKFSTITDNYSEIIIDNVKTEFKNDNISKIIYEKNLSLMSNNAYQ